MLEARKSKIFFIVMLLITVYLIVQFPEHTREVKRSRGWYTQPYIAPLVGLSILAFFSFLKLLTVIRPIKDEPSLLETLVSNLAYYRVVLITAVLFVIYLFSMSYIGFAPATFLFVLSLLWLSRLLNWFWALNTLVAVSLIVLIFRAGVNIWFPDVALYEHLFSDEILWFMNRYL